MRGMTAGEGDALAGWRARVQEHLGNIDPATLPEIPEGETPEDREIRLRLQAENLAKRWMTNLPVMYADASMADLEPAHRTAIMEWHSLEGMNLVLAGPVGTGKTHAAYATGHWLIARGIWVEAWAAVDLLDALKPGRDSEAEQRARECRVLILDDLGGVRPTDWAVERMLALLDERLRERRPTIWTTNATSEDLYEQWGHRLLDRMSYRQTVVKFTGESRRKAAW